MLSTRTRVLKYVFSDTKYHDYRYDIVCDIKFNDNAMITFNIVTVKSTISSINLNISIPIGGEIITCYFLSR